MGHGLQFPNIGKIKNKSNSVYITFAITIQPFGPLASSDYHKLVRLYNVHLSQIKGRHLTSFL